MTDKLPSLPDPTAWKYWHKVDSNRFAAVSVRLDMTIRGADEYVEIPLFTADQMRAFAEEALRLEREAKDTLLSDLRWRMDDIRDMLMQEGVGGNRIYGCDEWSTPTVNLQRAIDKIDAAIRARSEEPQ